MYQDTITLFNRTGDIWRATALSHVDLNSDEAALIAKYGTDSKAKASLHIRYVVNEVGPLVRCGPASYLVKQPREYTGADGTIAFRPASSGEVVDFFMEGVWDGEPVINDGDYDSGFFDHMSAAQDGVYTITSVARYSVIPHFEILGR